MGQYWIPVNLDKKEFINPHKLGSGLKLREQVGSFPATGTALLILCAAMPESRGGGDMSIETDLHKRTIGRWAGCRVALVGDYAEDADLKAKKGDLPASKIWDACMGDDATWKDITEDVCAVIEQELGGKFTGEGWRRFEFADR